MTEDQRFDAVELARRILKPAPGPILEKVAVCKHSMSASSAYGGDEVVLLRLPCPLELVENSGAYWHFDPQNPLRMCAGWAGNAGIHVSGGQPRRLR